LIPTRLVRGDFVSAQTVVSFARLLVIMAWTVSNGGSPSYDIRLHQAEELNDNGKYRESGSHHRRRGHCALALCRTKLDSHSFLPL